MPIAKESSEFTPAPAGTRVARCFGCISLGTQKADNPQFRDTFRILLMFELPDEELARDDNGKSIPMTVSKEYALSLGRKATLRKHLDSWRGKPFTEEELKGFEVSKVVGSACQLTIVHAPKLNGSGVSARIESVTGLVKGLKAPEQYHKSIKYEITDGKNEVYQALPEWIQKKIDKCLEWTTPAPSPVATEPDADGDDTAGDMDVPF